jgi:hypothetical protein
VHPEGGGPRSRRILEAVARAAGKPESYIDLMIERGELAMYGKRKGAKYGLPRTPTRTAPRRRARRTRRLWTAKATGRDDLSLPVFNALPDKNQAGTPEKPRMVTHRIK